MGNVSKEIERKADELVRKGRVRKDVETDKRAHFSVKGETEEHLVIFDKTKKSFTCDCRYFSLQGKECSHIVGARIVQRASLG
jgi:hypothetical protein